jgi:hypothetical protein
MGSINPIHKTNAQEPVWFRRDINVLKTQRKRCLCVGVHIPKTQSLEEMSMRNILLAALAAATVFAAVPASAQIYMGAGRGGAGVQVGPLGFGVGPRYGYRENAYRENAYRDYDEGYGYSGYSGNAS